jgi:WD40 repeat protein
MGLWDRLRGKPSAETPPAATAGIGPEAACTLTATLPVPAGRTTDGRANTSGLAVCADGSVALSGQGDGLVRVWDPARGVLVRTLEGHQWGSVSVDVSTDGSTAVSACREGTLCVWDLSSGALRRCIQTGGALECVTLAADCTVAATNRDGANGLRDSAVLWDLTTGERVHELKVEEMGPITVAMSPTRSLVAIGTQRGRVELMSLGPDGRRATLEAHTTAKPYGAAVRFSGNGARLITHGKIGWGGGSPFDNEIKIWDPESGRCIATLTGHQGGVTGAVLSHDGALAVSTGHDKTVFLWDAAGGRPLTRLEGHAEAQLAALSGDGTRVVSGGVLDPMRFWIVHRNAPP